MASRIDQLYQVLPPFLQNLGVTWYGLKLYRREYGREFRRLLAEFEGNQWLSTAELESLQHAGLRRIIAHSYEHVPYYRTMMDERGLKPKDIATVEDLRKLPVTTREDVKLHRESMTATNMRRSSMILGHTSGTTGSPLEFFWDHRICRIKTVVDWRQKRIAGVDVGDRMAFFLARVLAPVKQKKPPFWRHNWVLNQLFCSSWHLSPENLPSYFRKFESFRPVAIEGYPSTMYILARYLLAQNRTFPLRVAFTSSETLMPQMREAMEKAFECPVFDFYGLAERVVFATECEHHEKHLNMDFSVTEVLGKDGQPTAPGEMGRIVATGLHNLAMPLIRYQTSDVTALLEGPCACGRGFSRMANVTTKDEDIVTAADGRYVSSSILNGLTHHLTTLQEHQIIQEDARHVVMKIVKGPGYSDEDTRFLLRGLKDRLGDGMSIELEFVDHIPRTKAGKFRWVISKVPLEF